MSYEQIASFAVDKILIPFALCSAQPLVTKIGEKATNKIERLYNKINSKFSSDPSASLVLKEFDNNPQEYKAKIETLIKTKMNEDSSFKDEVSKLTKEIQSDPTINVYFEKVKGDRIVGQEIENMDRGISHTFIKDSEQRK